MKKNIILLTFFLATAFLATAFQGFAQDTLTGVVNRVAAPYFEQSHLHPAKR